MPTVRESLGVWRGGGEHRAGTAFGMPENSKYRADTYGWGAHSALRAKSLESGCLGVKLAGFAAFENNAGECH